jgi:hypothetical protein
MIDLFSEVSDENPCEKYASCPKANAAKLEAAKSHANNADKGKQSNRMCDRLRCIKVEKPAHP